MMKFEHGITLIETMVTIAIAAILMSLAVPSFMSLFNRSRVANAANTFISDIYYARSEAIKRSTPVVICMSNDQASCTGAAGNVSNPGWTSGWIIFVDSNADGTLNAGEPVIRVQGALNLSTTFVGGGAQTQFAFNAQGSLTTAIGGDTVHVCTTKDLTLSRAIQINASGLLSNDTPSPALAACP